MKNPEKDNLEGIEISIKPMDMMPPDLNGIVINEILADPNIGGDNGTLEPGEFDTDGDGNAEDADEFVELYNISGTDVDVSGWTLTDAANNTFTFPMGTVIPAGEHVVIVRDWGGGGADPQPAWVFTGVPALNNGGDVLTLSDGMGGSVEASYNGDGIVDDFGNDTDGMSLDRDPDGSDTIVSTTPNPECFLEGTRILTSQGYKKVEQLSTSDMVITVQGTELPVRWIGIQTIKVGTSHPVRIATGALGENKPHNDLYVSPDHALFVEGLLINAGALVNGQSIETVTPEGDFKYYHVELDSHALLIAEGALVESYLAQNEDRDAYDNGHERADDSKIMLMPLRYPRISTQSKVPATVEQSLRKRAQILKTA